jgi:hypothetical protein
MGDRLSRRAVIAVRVHARELMRRGERLAGGFSEADTRAGVTLLRRAQAMGLHEAGFVLAGLPSAAREMAALTSDERIALLLAAAHRGNPIAALDLYYDHGRAVDPAVLLAVLEAAAPGSGEAGEIAARLRNAKS